MWVMKWTIRSADAFIYFSWEGKSGKSTQFDCLIVETAEREAEGSQELWQVSIANQWGNPGNWPTRQLLRRRSKINKQFNITRVGPEHLHMAVCTGV